MLRKISISNAVLSAKNCRKKIGFTLFWWSL